MSFDKICFVISPIGSEDSDVRKKANNVFKYIINPALESFDLVPYRSDQISISGSITEQMFEYILKSKLCVVLLTGNNPNVFYELAVAQCAGRPTVLLVEKNSVLPFDIKDLRIIEYDLSDPERVMDKRDAQTLISFIQDFKNADWQAQSLFMQYPFGPKILSEKELQLKTESYRPAQLNYSLDKAYNLPGGTNSILQIVTGSIENIENIDVIINSENTDLQLARFYDQSMSGVLRYLDAEKDLGGNISKDALNEKMQQKIKLISSLPVQAGTVIITETTGLTQQGTKYIFHLALARGEIGKGYYTVIDRMEAGIKNVFKEFANLKKTDTALSSILFPLLGAGTAKLDPNDAAKDMVDLLVSQVTKLPFAITVYLLALRESHRIAFQFAAKQLNLTEKNN